MKISKKRVIKLRLQQSLFIFTPFYVLREFICLLFGFYYLILIFYLFFQFHRLSAAVYIADTAYGAGIVFALTYHFEFKPASLTDNSLTITQFTAVHLISPHNT